MGNRLVLNDEWKKIVVDGNKLEEFTSIAAMGQYKIQIALEVLEGCSYMCPGCFVKRRGNWNPESISLFHKLATELKDRTDVVLDDLVIGPTDFYGAENLVDIINDPLLAEAISMMPKGNKNIQHNCSILGSLSEKDIDSKIKLIEESPLGKATEAWDVQIAIDTVRLLNDPLYLKALDDRIETFKASTLNFEVSMATNIVDGVEDIIYEAIDFIRNRYQTVIEILPSVVRSFDHSSKHGEKLFEWNDMLSKLSIDAKRFKSKFHFLQGDISHKAINYSVVNIHQGKMYMAPFIYENAQIYKEAYRIDKEESVVNSIMTYKDKAVINQVKNSSDKECGECKYLNICSHRLIPMTIDTVFKGRTECILNKEVIALFDDEVYRGGS